MRKYCIRMILRMHHYGEFFKMVAGEPVGGWGWEIFLVGDGCGGFCVCYFFFNSSDPEHIS